MKEQERLRCPICGKSPKISRAKYKDTFEYKAFCYGHITDCDWYATPLKALEDWNNRVRAHNRQSIAILQAKGTTKTEQALAWYTANPTAPFSDELIAALKEKAERDRGCPYCHDLYSKARYDVSNKFEESQ